MQKLAILLFWFVGSSSLLHTQHQTLFQDSTQAVPTTRFNIIEEEAMPVGGMKAFYKTLHKNLHYPEEAKRHGVSGTAYIRFIIDAEGNVSEAEAVEGREVGYGIDEEAIRLVKLTKWEPGRAKGVAVPQRKILPVKFTHPNKKKRKNSGKG